MGILKHFVLPLFVVAHVITCVPFLTGNKQLLATLADWPDAADERTPIELHLIGALSGTQLAMAVGCILGIMQENAHFRCVLVLMELIMWGSDLVDSLMTGFPIAPPIFLSLVSLIGLFVHSKEPGIFTKDKTKTKSG
jgi:hypothetical protein